MLELNSATSNLSRLFSQYILTTNISRFNINLFSSHYFYATRPWGAPLHFRQVFYYFGSESNYLRDLKTYLLTLLLGEPPTSTLTAVLLPQCLF